MMICPECKNEMSKKWQPKSADEPAAVFRPGVVMRCADADLPG